MTKFDALLISLLTSSQDEIHKILANSHGFKNFTVGKDKKEQICFSYRQGDRFKPLIVCHSDTVHKKLPSNFEIDAFNNLSAKEGIGGDDRLGLWHLIHILKTFPNYSFLVCCDEEIGGIGAEYFTQYVDTLKNKNSNKLTDDFKYPFIVGLDRKGQDEAVFYSCGNKEFKDHITEEYFFENTGSFSDISTICPFLDIAGVNISTGVEHSHSVQEYIPLNDIENINMKIKLLLYSMQDKGRSYDFQEENIPKFYTTAFWKDYNKGKNSYSHSYYADKFKDYDYKEEYLQDAEELEGDGDGFETLKSQRTSSKSYYDSESLIDFDGDYTSYLYLTKETPLKDSLLK